jgi:hypothetical protein
VDPEETTQSPRLKWWRNAAVDLIIQPETVNDGPVRLGIAVVLSGAAVLFFRQEALQFLVASALGALLVLGALYVGYHLIGLRQAGRLWPGFSRGLATGLLFFCLCPPGLPLPLVVALAALAVLVEGWLLGLMVPLAISGVMVAWPLAWLWHVHAGGGYLSPFQLRPQLEPIALWTKFQLELDSVRLYTGNVAGSLGSTSFGLAMLGFLILAFLRRASWLFLLAFYVPIAAVIALTRNSLPVYLISGTAVVFAGLVAAEVRRLPLRTRWRLGAGGAAGLLTAALLLRGGGSESYGEGIIAVALLVSLLQLFGLAGSPAVISEAHPAGGKSEPPGQTSAAQLAALVVFPPAGLLMVWRDESLPPSQRKILSGLGLLLYILVLGGALLWLWALRLPA